MASLAHAAPTANYYDSVNSANAATLRATLHEVIDDDVGKRLGGAIGRAFPLENLGQPFAGKETLFEVEPGSPGSSGRSREKGVCRGPQTVSQIG